MSIFNTDEIVSVVAEDAWYDMSICIPEDATAKLVPCAGPASQFAQTEDELPL